jgi:hypothetical protein
LSIDNKSEDEALNIYLRGRIFLSLLVLGLLFATAGGVLGAPYEFDSNNQAWKAFEVSLKSYGNYGAEQILPDGAPALWDTESNGNGFVYLKADSQKRPRPYSIGATTGLVELGDLNGRTLTVDLKRLGDQFATLAASGQETATVRWVIADTDRAEYGVGTWYVSKLAYSINLNSIPNDWTTYSIKMEPGNFFLWPYGVNATNPGQEATFTEVMNTYKYVGLTLLSNAPDDSSWSGAWQGTIWTLPDYGAYAPAPTGGSGGGAIFAVDNFQVQNNRPPAVSKSGTYVGNNVVSWRQVWINNANSVSCLVRIDDPLPAHTSFVAGSLVCSVNGVSQGNCRYDAVAGTVTWEGTLGPDPGAVDEQTAVNEVVIEFQTLADSGGQTVENKTRGYWDENYDNDINDDISGGQVAVTAAATVDIPLPPVPTLDQWGIMLMLIILGIVAGRKLVLKEDFRV